MSFVFTLFLFTGICACSAQTSKGDRSILASIDKKLNAIAKKLNARIATDDVHYSSSGIDTLESRRLIWFDGDIGKAIVIEPEFLGGNLKRWNLFIVAWLENSQSRQKPMFQEYLMKGATLGVLKKNIDKLINDSEAKLKKIELEDLK